MSDINDECDAWSSGESEGDSITSDDDIFEINDDDLHYLPGEEIFYDNHFYPSIKDFIGSGSSISEDAPLNGNKPINYFQLFFDDFLLDLIVQETNIYQNQNPEPVRQKMAAWVDVTREELKKFLGLTILMGHLKKISLEDYWSTNPLLVTPIFPQTMHRNRYNQILRYLHFHNNQVVMNHPLKKVKVIIDNLNAKFSRFLKPGKKMCIDESLLLWKGRLKFKQYIPLKRHRFGIKLFEHVDCSSGYILSFIVYTGADTDYEKFGLGISGDIVAHFLKPYFGKGHVIYIDNWYSSAPLSVFLHEKETGVCGTVRKNRKGLPNFKTPLKKGESEVAHNNLWMVVRWFDKKEVYMITTVHEFNYAETGKQEYTTGANILKPTCIIDYNKNMGGVDNVDRQLALSESVRKSTRWYKKLFFHLVDLSLINGHALYKLHQEKTSFSSFRMKIIAGLLGIEKITPAFIQPPPLRLVGRHFPACGETKKRCYMCSLEKKRKESKYCCKKCNVALCVVPCFEKYHTLGNLTDII
ncbi:PREDICTED: piggyBac transposable element-derived protein 4 [Trachymyrmex cornetzi]|uniref:piggyBac transposable element-derived protein 4 n=1 Tax=Trachymyrmex cornetzi TaxID=471704 RepID=UPI00084F2D58|nr:PREDICTED: piggyBac transposable element-derived protein 4 [Trachymyrmex cornetzi]